MKRLGWKVLAAAATVPLTVQVASAQLPGIPYGPVNTGLGINVAADYGKPTSGGGSAWGLTGGLGVSNLGISASYGSWSPPVGSSQSAFAGMIGMKLFGGGLTPVTIGAQVGGSYMSVSGTSTAIVMPAAWVKVSPPLFPLKPWGQVYDAISNQANATGSKSEVRYAIGANFNLLLGFGVHAAYDASTKSGGANFWGVGVHMNFRVPSLGVPGVPGI